MNRWLTRYREPDRPLVQWLCAAHPKPVEALAVVVIGPVEHDWAVADYEWHAANGTVIRLCAQCTAQWRGWAAVGNIPAPARLTDCRHPGYVDGGEWSIVGQASK